MSRPPISHSAPSTSPRGVCSPEDDKPPVLGTETGTPSLLEDSGLFHAAIPPPVPSRVILARDSAAPNDAARITSESRRSSFTATLRTLLLDSRFQIPVAGIALASMGFGILLGVWVASVMRLERGVPTAANSPNGPNEAATFRFWGRLQVLDGNQLKADGDARVLLLPLAKRPRIPLAARSLNPHERGTTLESDDTATQLAELGGAAVATKSDGTFEIELPLHSSQRYIVLALSAASERNPNDAIESSTMTELRGYFRAPEEVIGKSRFFYTQRAIDAETPPLLHVF